MSVTLKTIKDVSIDSKVDTPKKDLNKMMEETIEITKDLQEKVQKIYRFIIWQRIFRVLKVLIFVIPIILGIIYLPTILETYLGPYKELLEGVGGGGIDFSSLLKQ